MYLFSFCPILGSECFGKFPLLTASPAALIACSGRGLMVSPPCSQLCYHQNHQVSILINGVRSNSKTQPSHGRSCSTMSYRWQAAAAPGALRHADRSEVSAVQARNFAGESGIQAHFCAFTLSVLCMFPLLLYAYLYNTCNALTLALF